MPTYQLILVTAGGRVRHGLALVADPATTAGAAAGVTLRDPT
ncbi:hypothetical protein ACFFX1_10515 [Dactylosporangium sucinum]|nr:hypothetical protein [Dactylosporangium sucinum]